MNVPDNNENYKDVEYWDERYGKEESYEWCKDYSAFKTLFTAAASPSKSDRILVTGCGNSNLSLDLYNDGFTFVTNVDYSSVVITKMKERYGQLMEYAQMDMRSLTFPAETFDLVIEKGTLDVLFTAEKSVWALSAEAQSDLDKTLSSVVKVLKPGGRFISITFAEPYFRKQQYTKYWSSIEVSTFGDFFHYYFYTCCNPWT